MSDSKEYKVGDFVFAEWSKNDFYFAEITRLQCNGRANVKFYDGNELENVRIGYFHDMLETHNAAGNPYLDKKGPCEVLEWYKNADVRIRFTKSGKEETLPIQSIIFTTPKQGGGITSNEEVTVEQWKEYYNNVSAELFKTVKYCSIGWMLAFLGMINVYIFFLTFIGFLIIAMPMTIKWYKSGWSSLFYWREYEVITTYSDGRQSSDHGAESFQLGMLFKAIMLVFVMFASCFFMFGKIIYLTFKCFLANKNATGKPFAQSGIFKVILMGLAVLVIIPIISLVLSHLPIKGNLNYSSPQTQSAPAEPGE